MIQSQSQSRVSQWCYRGVWGVLTRLLLVPERPPDLPAGDQEVIACHRPAPAYLAYRKLLFWIGLAAMDLVLIAAWVGFSFYSPKWGLITAPLWLAAIVLPDLLTYVVLHLAYDTTWYVLSERGMRIRRGIWTIRETTITFENVQNVNIVQGPIERWFGFANLSVSTAGGGNQADSAGAHSGWLEGIQNAQELRQMIMDRTQHNAGLGDEPGTAESIAMSAEAFSPQQILLLREIQTLAARYRTLVTDPHSVR